MDWARHGWVEWSQRIWSLWAKAPRRSKPRVGQARPACHPLWERRCAPKDAELQLYQEMRRTFPLLDVAVTRLVQLCGHPGIEGPPAVREELQQWLERVPTGPAQRGLGSWVETHLDHMLVTGRGVGKIRLSPSLRDLEAVLSIEPRMVRLALGCDGLSFRVWETVPGRIEAEELPPALALVSLRAPQGAGCGTSLLRSLPFVAEACSTIENATAQVWQRMGAPSFHVNWDEAGADPEGTNADSSIAALEESFTDMMRARRTGDIRDWFTSGKVAVNLLGSPGQITAVEESFRVFAEQMVAATGLPPWLLGLHWSSTERMSVQQADLLVANIEALRREIQPQIEYVLDLRQRLRGKPGRFSVVWPPVNLRDATEQARAEAWREQGRQRRIENARRMWELGFWSQERAARDADETLTGVHRRLAEPPSAAPTRTPERLGPVREDE